MLTASFVLPQLGGLEAPRESPMAGPAAKKLEKLVADVSAIQKSHEQFARQQKVRPPGLRRAACRLAAALLGLSGPRCAQLLMDAQGQMMEMLKQMQAQAARAED